MLYYFVIARLDPFLILPLDEDFSLELGVALVFVFLAAPPAELETIERKSPDFKRNFIAKFPSKGELSFLSPP